MLEERDLQLIKKVVHEVIEEDVYPHFVDIYDRFENIDRRFDAVDKRFDAVDEHFERVEKRLSVIETTMVTKDYLEDRLADFKITLKQSGGRALRQIKTMATALHTHGSLSAHQVVEITSA